MACYSTMRDACPRCTTATRFVSFLLVLPRVRSQADCLVPWLQDGLLHQSPLLLLPVRLDFEVLDLARVLYLKKLEAAEESNSAKGKSAELPEDLKHIKERLADTYDLQAEISLEAERFSDAVTDLRTALDLRYSLFPFEDRRLPS